MFNRILIANRGEIAVRILRACKELGIETIAVFSEADRHALHVQMADEAYCIGPAKSALSYLNMNNLISLACAKRAQAIHPGFGFLAENSVFATMCEECKIKFIGPSSETIDLMGNKANARKLMQEAGVPIIPGSGILDTVEEALAFAERVKYPVLLKAVAGGGGKGIRMVKEESEMEAAFLNAKNEAKAAFGNDDLYLEKCILSARHIEVQILADEHGNVVHLGERDCSLQRRKQKILEESPSLALDEKTRQQLGESAVRAAKAAGYKNAGTIEFLYDGEQFYFMEMNTRIQVEHPVTEMLTGIDIVKEQFRIAYGESLGFSQEDIRFTGHVIECRINAENPQKNFAPSPGEIKYLFLPGGGLGLRVDSAIYAGYTVPAFYDSMLAKIIVAGIDRNEAIIKMRRALGELVIDGIDTNVDFLLHLLNDKDYCQGNFDTNFVDRMIIGG